MQTAIQTQQATTMSAIQTQQAMTMSAATAATTTIEEIKPIMSASSALPIQPNYPVTIDNATKNLNNEQDVISTQDISGSSTQMQAVSQVNFASTTGSYTSISTVPHMFSNQTTANYTSGKYN